MAIGPYKGQGSKGKKTSDATITDAGKVGGDQRQPVIGQYNEHQKAVSKRSNSTLEKSRVPEWRQN